MCTRNEQKRAKGDRPVRGSRFLNPRPTNVSADVSMGRIGQTMNFAHGNTDVPDGVWPARCCDSDDCSG
eukprot:3878462-Prymnesium_polylepis.1